MQERDDKRGWAREGVKERECKKEGVREGR